MGLDDFMSGDSGRDSSTKSSKSSSSSKSKTSSNNKSKDSGNPYSKLLERGNFYQDEEGNVKQKGPVGYESWDKYNETIYGHIEIGQHTFKNYMPIIPHIDKPDKYKRSRRYYSDTDAPGTSGVYSCVSDLQTELRKIPRELVMLDTGEVEKNKCMNVISERLDIDVKPDTEVSLYMFARVKHVAGLALADAYGDDTNYENLELAKDAIYNIAGANKARDGSTDRDVKMDHIDMW